MKHRKGEVSPMLILFSAIILIFIALVFINSVADSKARQTELLTVANESTNLATCVMLNSSNGGWDINISDADCNVTVDTWYTGNDWRLNSSECYISSVTVKNGTSSALTLNTDYKIWSNMGKIQYLNTVTTRNLTGNLSYLVYSYCDSGYMTNSGDRSLANLWTTMMILSLIGLLVVIVFRIYNNK